MENIFEKKKKVYLEILYSLGNLLCVYRKENTDILYVNKRKICIVN